MSSLKQRAYDAWFRHVHGSRLIYNTCWEDPRADRADYSHAARVVKRILTRKFLLLRP